MKCMNGCGTVLTGRQRTFCSDKCRMEHNRANKTPQNGAGLENSNKPEQICPAKSNSVRVTVKPERSRTTGCKCAIPGDEDYVGVCELVDGQWTVKKTEPLPVKSMTRQQLERAINRYRHDGWVKSPEHNELTRRLNTMSIEQLESEGYSIPMYRLDGKRKAS